MGRWRPKSVEVGSRVFAIDYVKSDPRLDGEAMGVIEYELGQITVLTHLFGRPLSDDAVIETVAHEIIHAWLFFIGRDDLANDEQFVQLLAGQLAQTLQTLG